jgi:NAD(P)-dependent dehydrogenase (short-subunit alcohol dehydrogenase family)
VKEHYTMQDRVAIVTGAGRGIGRSTAKLLAQRGARVMVVARTEDELRTLADEQPGIEILAASLHTPEACAKVIAETRSRLGPISIVVNNAGVGSADDREIWDQPLEAFRYTMAVNLEAPLLLSQEASRDMRAAGWGRIVIVASTAGEIGSPRNIAYTTSKHAVIGLMRAAAQDVGTFGATCNAVLPGWVYTSMADRSAERHAKRQGRTVDEIWAWRDQLYPRGKALMPEEIAEVIAFLCTDAASGVNGEALTVAAGALE